MAGTKNDPEPEPPNPDGDPIPDDEDAQWAKASPRLKAIFRESLEEWFAENPETKDDDAEDTADDRGQPAGPAGKRRTGLGIAGPAAAAGRGANGSEKPKARQAPRPSGGSILDVLIGH